MKRVFRTLKAIRMLRHFLGTAGALSMLFTGTAHVAPIKSAYASPLLGQTDESQGMVLQVIATIRTTGGGNLTKTNAARVINKVLAKNHGLNLTIMAHAINRMDLQPSVLKVAIDALVTDFHGTQDHVVALMVSDTYMNHGRSDARRQISALKRLYGESVTGAVMNDGKIAGLLNVRDLNNLTTAAGGGVYDG